MEYNEAGVDDMTIYMVQTVLPHRIRDRMPKLEETLERTKELSINALSRKGTIIPGSLETKITKDCLCHENEDNDPDISGLGPHTHYSTYADIEDK